MDSRPATANACANPAADPLPRQPCDEAPDSACADDRDAVSHTRLRIPEPVDRGLQIGCQHGARRGHIVGQRVHGGERDSVARLMGIEHENPAAAQIARAALNHADARVPVFHRRREVAVLERRAHPLILAGRYPAQEHERF